MLQPEDMTMKSINVDDASGLNTTFTCDSDNENSMIERPSIAFNKDVVASERMSHVIGHEKNEDFCNCNLHSSHPEFFFNHANNSKEYSIVHEKAVKLVNDLCFDNITKTQSSLVAKLTNISSEQRRTIEFERRKVQAFSGTIAKPHPSQVKTQEIANAIKADLDDVIRQYEGTQNLVNTMVEQHLRYMLKDVTWIEKIQNATKHDVENQTAYQESVNRYNTLLTEITEISAEGDATCEAFIERQKTATLDIRTKSQYLSLKKRNLAKQKDELNGEVSELMDMFESLLAARAVSPGTQKTDDATDESF